MNSPHTFTSVGGRSSSKLKSRSQLRNALQCATRLLPSMLRRVILLPMNAKAAAVGTAHIIGIMLSDMNQITMAITNNATAIVHVQPRRLLPFSSKKPCLSVSAVNTPCQFFTAFTSCSEWSSPYFLMLPNHSEFWPDATLSNSRLNVALSIGSLTASASTSFVT